MSGERRPLVDGDEERLRPINRFAMRTWTTVVIWLAVIALVGVILQRQWNGRTVLDDQVEDPLSDLDSSDYAWRGLNSDNYDPVSENILATDDEAFDVPFTYTTRPLSRP